MLAIPCTSTSLADRVGGLEGWGNQGARVQGLRCMPHLGAEAQRLRCACRRAAFDCCVLAVEFF
jgi:hypothetical protein